MFAALHCLELPILKNLRIYLYFRIFFSRWFKYSTVNNDKKNYPISGNMQSNIFDIVSKTLFTCIHHSEFRFCLKRTISHWTLFSWDCSVKLLIQKFKGTPAESSGATAKNSLGLGGATFAHTFLYLEIQKLPKPLQQSMLSLPLHSVHSLPNCFRCAQILLNNWKHCTTIE